MAVLSFIRNTPHLPVNNLKQTIEYYRDTLGFNDEWTTNEKDGGISRNEMRLLFEEDPEFVKDINNDKHRLPLMWLVENINEVYTEFLEKKIIIADRLRLHPYGLREFAFIDINGYYVRIAEAAE